MSEDIVEKEKQIEQEVEKTLQCLDQIEEIETNPFFYTRLQARLSILDEQREHSFFKIFSPNFLRPAFIMFMIVLNIASAVFIFQGKGSQYEYRTEYIKAFANEYSLDQDNYDLLF
jgi:hypothetical protein